MTNEILLQKFKKIWYIVLNLYKNNIGRRKLIASSNKRTSYW